MITFRSLKLKIILPVLFILIVVFLVSSLVIIDRESKTLRDSIIQNAESFSSLAGEYIINNYETYYESGFYKFIEIIDEIMSLNQNIKLIQIFDVNGKILFNSTELTQGKYDVFTYGERFTTDQDLIQRAGSANPSEIFLEETNQIDIMQPYFEEWGRHDYSIRYIFSLVSLDQMRTEMITTVLLYSLLFVFISFLLIYILFNFFITTPIRKLTKGTRRMSSGNLGHKVDIDSSDEIGELTKAFNKMSVDLKKSRDSLEDYSKNLENKVEERTRELEEKTIHLEKTNIELQKAREELDLLNKNLEKRVKDRTAEVESLLKQKDEFINQLGHDLKTPLGPLINGIPLLEEKETDKKRKEWLQVLHRNVDYMKNLVVKTLELAKLNSPKTKFSLETLNLHNEINKILQNKKIIIDEKQIKTATEIKDTLLIKVDKLRFEELLTNLLENAVKYSKKQGQIKISAEQQNDFIKISVQDSGKGMTKNQIEHVFEEFYKADKSRHDFESSGLGMSICKRIVERHGGQIWVESPGIGKGTTVSFTLPSGSS